MRRFARHLFTVCSALSLLLCVAACVLWVRNFFVADSAAWRTADRVLTYNAERNVIRLMSYADAQVGEPLGWSGSTGPAPDVNRGLWQELRTFVATPYSRFGFGFTEDWTDRDFRWKAGGRPIYALYLPHWFVVILTAVLPTLWLRWTWRPWRLRRLGLCPACGYDLRASPDRCPECGAEAIAGAAN